MLALPIVVLELELCRCSDVTLLEGVGVRLPFSLPFPFDKDFAVSRAFKLSLDGTGGGALEDDNDDTEADDVDLDIDTGSFLVAVSISPDGRLTIIRLLAVDTFERTELLDVTRLTAFPGDKVNLPGVVGVFPRAGVTEDAFDATDAVDDFLDRTAGAEAEADAGIGGTGGFGVTPVGLTLRFEVAEAVEAVDTRRPAPIDSGAVLNADDVSLRVDTLDTGLVFDTDDTGRDDGRVDWELVEGLNVGFAGVVDDPAVVVLAFLIVLACDFTDGAIDAAELFGLSAAMVRPPLVTVLPARREAANDPACVMAGPVSAVTTPLSLSTSIENWEDELGVSFESGRVSLLVARDARTLGDTVLVDARDAVDIVLRATERTEAPELVTGSLAGLCAFRLSTLARRDCAWILSVSSFRLGARR